MSRKFLAKARLDEKQKKLDAFGFDEEKQKSQKDGEKQKVSETAFGDIERD